MFVLEDKFETNHTVYFDVDDTLILWLTNSDSRCEQALLIDTPWWDGSAVIALPIESHIRALKQHKERGDQIIVWSQGGSAWAKKVVETLQLEQYVDVVMSKPTIMYDDVHPTQWGYQFIYSPEETLTIPDPRDEDFN